MQLKTLLAITLCAVAVRASGPVKTPLPPKCSEKEIKFLIEHPKAWKGDDAASGELADATDKTLDADVTKEYTSTTPALFKTWKAFHTNALEMLAHGDSVKTSILPKEDYWKTGSLLARQNLFKAVKPFWGSVDLSKLPDSMCRFFFDQKFESNENYPLKDDQFKSFRMACFSDEDAAKASIKNHWTAKMIAQIPAEQFGEHNAIDLALAPARDGTVYSKLSKEQVSYLIANTDNCAKLSEAIVTSNQQNEVVALFQSPCLSKMDWLTTAGLASPTNAKTVSWLRALPENAFSSFPKLASGVAKHLTGNQIAKFDSACPNVEFRCLGLPIDEVAKQTASSLTKECIAGRVNNASTPIPFGELAAKLPADAFSGVFPDETIIEHVIDEKNVKFLTADHYKTLLALTPKAWNKLVTYTATVATGTPAPAATFPWDRLPVVTGEALRNMKSTFLESFLASHKALRRLSEDALADFTSADATLSATSSTSTLIKREALNMIAKVNHMVIHNLGRDVPAGSTHVCATVNLKDYKEHQGILDHAGHRCIRSLGGIDDALETDNAEVVAKLPAMVLASFDYDRLMKFKDVLPKGFFAKMTPSIFAVFATPANCGKLSGEIVGSLSADVFARMSLDCFAALKVDLAAAQIGKLPSEIFARFTSDLFTKLKIYTSLTVEQLASLSTGIAEPAKHAAHAVTKAIFAGFTPAQVGALNERTVALMPIDNWEALTADMLKAMKPEVFVSIDAERMLKVPVETRHVLSAAQAKMLGSKVASKEQHPRAAFPPEVLEQMVDKEAVKIIMASAGTMVVASMGMIVVSVLFGLLLL